MSDNPETGPLSVEEAVNLAMTSQEAPPQEEATPDEAPVVEVEAEAEETEAETPEEDVTDAEDEGPQILTMDEYGDVQIQVGDEVTTLADLQKGTLRQQDYTRKTQELSEHRKALEAKEAEIAEKQRQLDAAILNANGDEQEPDWLKMAEEDPLGFVTEKAKWDQKQAQRQAALQAQQQAQMQQALAFRQKTAEQALAVYPSWSDADAYKQGEPARRALAEKIGFSAEEYNGVNDMRLAALLEMAVKGQAQQTEEKAAEKKIRKAPKVLKPGTTKSKADGQAADKAARKAKLSRPHSLKEHLAAMYD